MLHVHLRAGFNAGQHVASINQQDRAADTFCAASPWLLLFVDGRVMRFPTATDARNAATARFAPCKFTRA